MKTKPFDKFTAFNCSPINDASKLQSIIAGAEGVFRCIEADVPFYGVKLADAFLTMFTTDKQFLAEDTACMLSPLLHVFNAHDPAQGQYMSLGFVPPTDYVDPATEVPQYLMPITGIDHAYLINAEWRERVLPGASVRDALEERVKQFEEREGRPAHKKDWAVLKDEVTGHLLKTAPVRRTLIPIIMYGGRMFIFTTSNKKAETVTAMLRRVFGTWPVSHAVFNHTEALQDMFDRIATPTHPDTWEDRKLWPSVAGKMTDGDATVTINKEAVQFKEGWTAYDLHSHGYRFEEMQFKLFPFGAIQDEDGEPECEGGLPLVVKLNTKGVVKKFTFGELSTDAMDRALDQGIDPTDDSLATKTWMVLTGINQLLAEMDEQGALMPREDLMYDDEADADVARFNVNTHALLLEDWTAVQDDDKKAIADLDAALDAELEEAELEDDDEL